MVTATSQTTIDRLRNIIAMHGLPHILITDNRSQFTSNEFQEFLRASGIKHVCSSPYHPSTNGLAERGIQAFKNSMKRLPEGSISRKVSQFWFWYRLTSHSTTDVPPAELLLGRRLRSELDFLK